jgi:hypothetical protein
MVYPAIIQSAFGMFSCTDLEDGSRALNSAPHLDCDTDEAHVTKSVAAASLALWGACFPIFLGWLIRCKASNPKFSFVIVSYGYRVNFRNWEAWECLKKFAILLIFTFLQFAPELAATALLVFIVCALVITAECAPFVSSLVNKVHLACDLLIFFVLATGLLSMCAGEKLTEQIDTISLVVVSFAACILVAIAIILWFETGSTFQTGGKRQAMWDGFLESKSVADAKRLSRRLSDLVGFAMIVPEPLIPEVTPLQVQPTTTSVPLNPAVFRVDGP